MSNVLEHIEERVPFLKGLVERFSPSSMLLRLPMVNRSWRVALRKELGLSQYELAEKLGVDHPAISAWENGAHVVPKYIAKLIGYVEKELRDRLSCRAVIHPST